jgi:hypothetical protein
LGCDIAEVNQRQAREIEKMGSLFLTTGAWKSDMIPAKQLDFSSA